MQFRLSPSVLEITLAFAIPCWSQQVIRTFEEVCTDLDWLPDLDEDGVPEVLLGRAGYDRPFRDAGLARIVSGRDGAVIRDHPGTATDAVFGYPVRRVGDTNGDGTADYAVGSYGLGTTSIFSGKDGSPLMELPYAAEAIAPLGDLNRDGLADFVLGRPFAFAGGEALVFEGGSFALRLHVVAPPEGFYFGAAVLGLEDVNGDEVPDFAVGAPGLAMDFTIGRTYVFSGADGRLIHDIRGDSCLDEFGLVLAGFGDLTDDGVADIAISAHNGGGTSCLFGGHGRVYYHDTVTGRRIGVYTVPGPVIVDVGQVIAGVGDLDGNGYDDLLVRHEDALTRIFYVRALDGRDRREIFEIDRPLGFVFAQKLIGVGDWTGDDFPDFLVRNSGFIDLYSSAPPGVRVLGEACVFGGGEPPRIGVTGRAIPGRRLPIHLSRVLPGEEAFLLVRGEESLLGRGHDLAPADCAVLRHPDAVFPAVAERVSKGRGVATVELPIPADPALDGAAFLAQWLIPGDATRGTSARTSRVLRVQIRCEIPGCGDPFER